MSLLLMLCRIVKINKKTIHRRVVSWLLAAALAIGLLPANAFAAEPLSTKKNTVINLKLASTMDVIPDPSYDPRNTVRYEIPATQADSVNLVFLVDTSAGDILTQFQTMMHTSGISYIYGNGSMDFGNEIDFVTRVISFGDNVQDSGNITNSTELENKVHNSLQPSSGTASETDALDKVIDAVKEIQGNHQYAYNPTVVFCVLGDNFGINNATAVEEKLKELSARFPSTAAGALITWQTQNGSSQNDDFTVTNSELLKRYATQYTKGGTCIAAYGNADSNNMAVCLERIVHDHIQDSSINLQTYGIDSIQMITGGSDNYTASINIQGQYDNPNIQLNLNRVCLQTPCYIDLKQVICQNITSPTVVIPQAQADANMYTGLFDEAQGMAQLNFPAVTYYGQQTGFQPSDPNLVTLTYDSGRGTGNFIHSEQVPKGGWINVQNPDMLSCANSAFGGWRGPSMDMGGGPDQIYAPNDYISIQQDTTLTAVYGAPAVQLEVDNTIASSSSPSGGIVLSSGQYDTETSFEYIIRVQYTGDDGARSGSVNLRMDLPQGVAVDNNSSISISGPQQMSDWSGIFMPEGTITQHPSVSGSTLTAAFAGMTAGTEFEIRVPCTINSDGVVNGNFECWDASAMVESMGAYKGEPLLVTTPTLRLWKNADQASGNDPEYALTYVYMGDVPDGVSAPTGSNHKENDNVTLASVSEVTGYTFEGWYRSDTHEKVSSPFTMPASPVMLYGTWTKQSPGNITVKYEYTRPDPNNDDIPTGAPDLEGEEHSVPVNGSYYIVWIGSDVSHHKFGGWTPKLTINGSEILLTDDNSDGIYTDSSGTYYIPVSGSLDASQFADETGAVVLTYSGPWEPYTGTIQFDGNGGQGSMSPLTDVAWCTKTQHLTKNQFTYPVQGYTFDGWSTTINGPKVKDDQALADKLIETDGGTVTLYARWVLSSYAVEYQLDGVNSSETTTSVSPGGNYTTTLSATDSGFTFRQVRITMGGRDVTEDAYNPDDHTINIPSVSGDIIIYAKAAAPAPEIAVDPQSMDFGTVAVGYTQPATQTVTVTNTGTEPITVNLPSSSNYTITAGTGFTTGTASLAVGGTASFSVQPKGELSADVYNETLTISTDTAGVQSTVTLRFTVSQDQSSTPTKHTITVSVTGGTASPNGTVTVNDGQDQTITFTPNSGNKLSSVTVDGTPTNLTGNSYTFTNVTADHSIAVVYEKDSGGPGGGDEGDSSPTKHAITVSVTGGTASPSGVVQVEAGQDQTITFTPNSGYELKSVTVDGSATSLTGNSYTFNDVTANHFITVVYVKGSNGGNSGNSGNSGGGGSGITKYPIEVDETGNGTATSDKDTAAEGEDVTIDTDGEVIDITATDKNGNEISITDKGDGSFTFEMPKSEVTVKVEFEPLPEVADPNDTGVADWLDTVNHNSYLSGYPDSTFRPSGNMTRAEVAQMFYNLLLNKDVAVTVSFSDVKAGSWYETAVNTLASLGIVTGVSKDQFVPERAITRAEFTAIAMRFAKLDQTGTNIFSDVKQSDWFYKYVVGSIQNGWITGYSDGTFRPNNTITRAEVTTITNRMLDRAADETYVGSNSASLHAFADVNRSHWAYYQIVEATNSHAFEKADGMETWKNLK